MIVHPETEWEIPTLFSGYAQSLPICKETRPVIVNTDGEPFKQLTKPFIGFLKTDDSEHKG
jgi:hypothetical protein